MKTKLLIVALAAVMTTAFVGCSSSQTSSGSSDASTESSSQLREDSSGSSEEAYAPESIELTNELNPRPGVFMLTVAVSPNAADARFTSTLLGEHEFVSLVDNELAISEEVPDLYQFTIEVVSVADPAVKSQKTFTVDNRPEDGLHITTKQKEIDAQVNEGKLQLTYTMVPEAEVTFVLEETTEGVSVSEAGEIVVDPLVNNGTSFTVVATAEANEQSYRETFSLTVKNEVEREISTEQELRAIWTGYNKESIARMKNFYKLTADIKLTSPWGAIGFKSDSEYEEFNGNFNGNGYTVSNFNMNAGWNNGFFYWIGEQGVVENLKLESGKGAGEGLSGMYSGPFAGWCFGTINNCIADVQVTSSMNSAGVHQPIGTFVGTIGVGGTVSNCIALGNAIVDKASESNPNENYRSGFVASVPGTLSQCLLSSYMLEGSAEFIVGRREASSGTAEAGMSVIQSREMLMKASTYADFDEETGLGFDRSIWRIFDGAMPCLLNDDFVEPASLALKVNGEDCVESYNVGHGEYAFEAIVSDSEGGNAGVSQSIVFSIEAANGVAEGAFTLSGNKVKVNAQLAVNGDVCTVTVASALNPSVKKTVTFTFVQQLAVILDPVPELEYREGGNNTFDLSAYVEVLGGSSATELTYEITSATPGVSVSGSVLTLSSAVNNTAVFKVKVSAKDGDAGAESEEIEISVKNLVYKQIGTAEAWLAIWTGDNEESRLHMHNNYVLTANIELGASGKAIGLGDTSGYCGFSGTIDGAGYTVSWTNTVSLGWNSGFIQRVEAGAVIKNLGLKGALKGYITGPIGLCYGTIENCYFDVAVTAMNVNQTYGSAVAALCGSGVMRNVISVGTVTPDGTAGASYYSGIYGKTHDESTSGVTIENCYALSGTVTDEENVLTEEQMKTAATFAGWDSTVWNISDGAYPTLKERKSE